MYNKNIKSKFIDYFKNQGITCSPYEIDILNNKVGAMNEHLVKACLDAMYLNRDDCYNFVKENYDWKKTTQIFISNLKV